MSLQLGILSHAVLACFCRQTLPQHAPHELVLHSLQALTEVNCKADIGGQHYFAGDASPLPSKLEGDSSWSPSNFLAPTPLGANTTEDTLSVLVDGLPTLSVMGTPPPPAGADPVLKHKSFSTQSPARLSGLTLTAKAKNQVIQLFLSHLEMPSTCP